MTRTSGAGLVTGLMVLMFACAEQTALGQSEPPTKTIEASVAAAPPDLDGDLSDAVWQHAQVISNFVQIQPVKGGVPTEKTEVRVVYTQDALYIAFACFDSEPDKILATQRRRDFSTSIGAADDAVNFVLDPSHEHRDGYQFKVNPLGTQTDQLIADTYRRTMQWDASWKSAARIHAWGWAAEIMIPFRMLQIRRRDAPVWGIDFKRTIGRKNEDIGWNNPSFDRDFFNLTYPGHLMGISNSVVGRSLKVKPYAAGGFRDTSGGSAPGEDRDLDIGIEDVRYTLTSNVNLNATLNPDFAQANVDNVQLNLTRFPLFFEERREFFLESAGLFDFGTGGSELKLLHTRRIGLTSNREPVPILYGGRLSGQTKRMQFGVMNVRTREHEGTDAQNFGIYRVKANVLPGSYVGLMATQVTGADGGQNITGGVDARLAFFSNRLRVQSFAARSTTEGLGGEGWVAMPLWLTWYTDLLEAQGQHMIIQEEFESGAGFVSRADIKKSHLNVVYRPRPRSEHVRQLTFNTGTTLFHDMDNRLMTRDVRAGAGIIMTHGDTLNVRYTRNFEHEDRIFNVAGRLPVPAGDYVSDQLSVTAETASNRRVSGGLAVTSQDFWGGTRRTLDFQPAIRWSSQLVTELQHTIERVTLPSGSFTARLSEATLHLNLTNQWLTRTTVQHNALDDDWGVHFRLNYMYRTGDNFFVVFSRTTTVTDRTWGIILKMTRTLDF